MSSNAFSLIHQSQLIRAGAGAGKTTRLISTFLDFVREFHNQNGDYPRVVITTFTRKATQEVKERLLVSAINEKKVFEYINQKSRVHISTIHGLLSLFLSQFADTIQFSSEIKVIDGPRYDKLLKRQMSELFKAQPHYILLLESYSFFDLVEIVKKALEYKSQNNSFKNIEPEILNLQAKADRKLIVDTIDEIFSFASTAHDTWKKYFLYLEQIKIAVLNNDIDAVKRVLEEAPRKPAWGESKQTLDPTAHDLVLILKDEYLENLWDSDEFISRHEEINSLFNDFLVKMNQISIDYKRRTGELTISDLENLSVKIIEQNPEAVAEFSASWDFFMIDEYQDTSPIQVKILNAIVSSKPCFIVGDPQQSIYLFRGARSEVFAKKQVEMENGGHKIDYLKTNYRSEPSLMSFINDFFSNFGGRFEPMNLKTESQFEKDKFHDVYFLKGDDQSLTVIEHIQRLMRLGASPEKICVLSRNNRNLDEIAARAFEFGLDVQLQSAAGFEQKREILDLIAFCRFLVNPHDSENLITLVRSPWLNLSDQQIADIRGADSNNSRTSLWQQLEINPNAVFELLKNYCRLFETDGALQAVVKFINDTSFLRFSALFDSGGKREANIIKFITSLAESEKQSGFSLGLFLEEKFVSVSVESGAADSEAQPVVRPNSVSLMTVHAAKGLQFEHVIVVGMSDLMTSTKTQKIMFDPESLKYSLSPFLESELKNIPSRWSYSLRNQMNRREEEEFERVLYVALTRAVRSLSLVANTSKRPNKNTWFAKINWPTEGEHFKNNYSVLSLDFENNLTMREQQLLSVSAVRQSYNLSEVKLDQNGSVTELLSKTGSGDSQSDLNLKLENLRKAQFGSDLHRVFEALKYSSQELIYKKLSPLELAAVKYLFSIEDFNFSQLLQIGHNEWGFGLQLKSRFVQGQIDLWAESNEKIYIIDYKTGTSDFVEKALDQLSFYTYALACMNQISKNKEIFLGVVYPIEKKVVKKIYKDFGDFEANLSGSVKNLVLS